MSKEIRNIKSEEKNTKNKKIPNLIVNGAENGNKRNKETPGNDNTNESGTTTSFTKYFAKEIKHSLKLSKKFSMDLNKDLNDILSLPKKETYTKTVLDIEIFKKKPVPIQEVIEKKTEMDKKKEDDQIHNSILDNTQNNSAAIPEKSIVFKNLIEENKQEDHNKFLGLSNMYAKQHEQKELQNQLRDVFLYQKRQEQLQSLKFKPEISKHSQKIFDNIGLDPIYKRVKNVVDSKNKKIENIKTKIVETRLRNENEETITFATTQQFDPERFEDWIEINKIYNDKKEEKLLKKRQEKIISEIDPPYIPEINNYSRKLVEQLKTEETVYHKLYKDSVTKTEKLQKKIRDLTPKFKPSINSKSTFSMFHRNSSELKDTRLLSKSKKFSLDNINIAKNSTINSSTNIKHTQPLFTEVNVKPKTRIVESLEKNIMENESFSKAMKIKCKAQTTVNSLNQEAAKEITKDDISYKININDGISCDLLKENNIVYCPSIKFDTFLKTFINTKDSKLETLN